MDYNIINTTNDIYMNYIEILLITLNIINVINDII
jgi:hypothetical protein